MRTIKATIVGCILMFAADAQAGQSTAPASGRQLLLSIPPMIAAIMAAPETITYGYDAKGRLTSVSRSGGASNMVATTYQYDAADNRRQVTTTH